jgi:hypothetical protein
MTKAKDQAPDAKDVESSVAHEKGNEQQELDAEIVRDLEAEGEAIDVRGGLRTRDP